MPDNNEGSFPMSRNALGGAVDQYNLQLDWDEERGAVILRLCDGEQAATGRVMGEGANVRELKGAYNRFMGGR